MHPKQRFAIVNGDDFGFSPGVNAAILQAHQQGVLTSTSLMVTGAACAEAVALAQTQPDLGVGLHLVLVCGKSVLPPERIPHLVDAQGRFPDSPTQAGLRYQFNPAARQELRREIRAQLEAFRQSGLPLAHVDGHLHLHAHPVVLGILIDLAPEFDIRVIRLPYEELSLTLKCDRRHWGAKAMGWWVFRQLRRAGEARLRRAGIHCAERVYGLLQSGAMSEAYLLALIPQIQANCIEIYLHPSLENPGEPANGPTGSGLRELQTLLSDPVKAVLATHRFQLTHYRNRAVFDRP